MFGWCADAEFLGSADVRLPHRLRTVPAVRGRLARVAGGLEPADLLLRGARVLNVFTSDVGVGDVAIAAGRIAAVGAPVPAARTVDLDGALVVPGLIDPHAHADMLCVPSAFLAAVASRGTTCVVLDTATLTARLDDARLGPILDALQTAATKVLWALRPTGDGDRADEDAADLPLERLRGLLDRDDVAGAGELTGWRRALDGDERLLAYLSEVADAGLRVDGHAPGASARTLAQQVALGVTSDHEAIDGAELERRVRLGLWSMLRHSSLRPDGAVLGRAVADRGLDTRRMLITADGVLPRDLVGAGHVDEGVRQVVAGGVPATEAIRMATLHAATYLGLDAHLGSLAPGRCADLVVLDGPLDACRPARVMTDGTWVDARAAGAADGIDWRALTVPIGPARLDAARLAALGAAGPVLRMHGAFARHDPGVGPGPTLLALVARDGRWVVATTVHGLELEAVASTFTGSGDVLLIGHDPAALLTAHAEVVRLGGGMSGPGARVALPVLGHLAAGPVDALARELAAFDAATGVPDWPPFGYLTTFLTLPGLPGVCVTPHGVYDVRHAAVLAAPTPL